MQSDKLAEAPYLDPADPSFSVRSEAVRAARSQGWYAHTPYGLAVLRYDAMKELLLHPALRQGSYRWPDHCGATGLWARWWKRIMLNVEGADHARLRRLAMPAFSPRLVSTLIPDFQQLCDALISAFEHDGRCEFMADFAEPYAAQVICALVGVDADESRALTEQAVQMGMALSVTYARDEAIADAAISGMFAFSERVVTTRRAAPRDDFITALIGASTDERLSEQELHDMIVLSIFGGIDTTRNQLGLAMAQFMDHPDQWRLLADNPDLARAGVEEVMRTRPTVTWVTREAVEDFTYNGLQIARGTTLHLFSESAATDPAHFSPGFDIAAKRKPHFGFGGGRHHCIGSPIARGDMTEALKMLAQRLPNPRTDGVAEWLPESGNTGPLRLPIRFDPPGG